MTITNNYLLQSEPTGHFCIWILGHSQPLSSALPLLWEKLLFSELHCNATTLGARADMRTRSLSRKILEMSASFQRVCVSMETGPKKVCWRGMYFGKRKFCATLFLFYFFTSTDVMKIVSN